MRSNVPGFHDPGSEDDDARWEAYQALMRRKVRHPAAMDAGFRYPDDELFEPAEVDAFADEPAADPVEDLCIDPPAPRSRRPLIIAVLAVTAGVIFAAALFPRPPSDRVVVLRSHQQVSRGDHTAPSKPAPPETLAEVATSEAPASSAIPLTQPPPPDRKAAHARHGRPPASPQRADEAAAKPAGKGSLDCWLTAMNSGSGSVDILSRPEGPCRRTQDRSCALRQAQGDEVGWLAEGAAHGGEVFCHLQTTSS
jgi:hypothetical protein